MMNVEVKSFFLKGFFIGGRIMVMLVFMLLFLMRVVCLILILRLVIEFFFLGLWRFIFILRLGVFMGVIGMSSLLDFNNFV